MNVWEAAFLGLIQGLTEFLPVSSSGHLVIFQDILGLDEPGLTLEVLLHFGTLFSVLFVFGKDFLALLNFREDRKQRYLIYMLLAGLVATGMIGILLYNFAGILFGSTLLVGFMLLVTGGILFLLTIIPEGKKQVTDMKVKDAIWIGLLQGFAVIPGISRSGSTIMAALWRGLDRETAVKYSFMLSAPVIFGATLLEIREMIVVGIEQVMVLNYLVGGLVAFLAGILAIKVFIRALASQKFHYFAYYCWAAGSLVIIISLIRL